MKLQEWDIIRIHAPWYFYNNFFLFTYDVDEAEEFIPGVLDHSQLLEVDVDHAGVVVQLVDSLPVVDQSRLVDEEGLLKGAEEK